MDTHRRKADGRRIFTPQFKQEQVGRLSRQEVTVAELAASWRSPLSCSANGSG